MTHRNWNLRRASALICSLVRRTQHQLYRSNSFMIQHNSSKFLHRLTRCAPLSYALRTPKVRQHVSMFLIWFDAFQLCCSIAPYQCVTGEPGAVDSCLVSAEPWKSTSNQHARPCMFPAEPTAVILLTKWHGQVWPLKALPRERDALLTSREVQSQGDVVKLLLRDSAKIKIVADRLTHKAAWIHSIHHDLQCSRSVAAQGESRHLQP